ncbi:hypothetical protein PR048_015635 [Dryococelus australis]|uniref:Uncharacterized protein n=1 Tax=Dryococelus australis TaxID=614101 RepID=A0ABQ9HHH1_9NEOP|nr:hypothetical protein PR048_015635 [Dryococelus australis]
MEELELIMPPDEFDKYTRGVYFTIRCNHEFRAGTWSNQLIEQDLMRPLKSQGCLVHGRAIGETALQAIVGKAFAGTKISRKARSNSLLVTHNTLTNNNKVVPVSENQLFMRIVCIMKSDTEKA